MTATNADKIMIEISPNTFKAVPPVIIDENPEEKVKQLVEELTKRG